MSTGDIVLAKSLKENGVDIVYGVVGVPVIETSVFLQMAGVQYYGFRNEQAASYAAGAYGYLTGRPGGCLCVSGPGVVHGFAGLSNAQANCWPMILIGGACAEAQQGMGAFQESPQLEWARPYCKYVARPDSVARIPFYIEQAVRASTYGRPGPVYIDLPQDLLRGTVEESQVWKVQPCPKPPRSQADPADVKRAAEALRGAKRPLLIVGKGAAYGRAEGEVQGLVASTNLPFLPTPMGKGVVPDDHGNNIGAARSFALENADVVVLLGARLNWILHFGIPPRFSKDVKVIQVDVAPEEMHNNVQSVALLGDCGLVVQQLSSALKESSFSVPSTSEWWGSLTSNCKKNAEQVTAMTKATSPMNYFQVFSIVRKFLPRESVIVSEGANTMDIGRSMMPNFLPRKRIDAGSYGTMGVGMGFAIAAASVEKGKGASAQKVVAVEGDSAFGFSGMELETISRYELDVCVVVVNNNGVFAGIKELPPSPSPLNLPPTALTPHAGYENIATAFGGKGWCVDKPEDLERVMGEAMAHKGLSLVNILIDPKATRKPQKHEWLTGSNEAGSKL